jgi:hypothetical protein
MHLTFTSCPRPSFSCVRGSSQRSVKPHCVSIAFVLIASMHIVKSVESRTRVVHVKKACCAKQKQ